MLNKDDDKSVLSARKVIRTPCSSCPLMTVGVEWSIINSVPTGRGVFTHSVLTLMVVFTVGYIVLKLVGTAACASLSQDPVETKQKQRMPTKAGSLCC
jgi:hypothetical protein